MARGELARRPQRVLRRVERAGGEPVVGHGGVQPGQRVAAERSALGEHDALAEERHALVDAPAGGEQRAQPLERERLAESGAAALEVSARLAQGGLGDVEPSGRERRRALDDVPRRRP